MKDNPAASTDSRAQFALVIALITLIGLFLRVFLLASQPVSLDDFDVALTAINYTEYGQLGPTMWNHPVLRNILVYCFMKLFGTSVIGLKGTSLLMGTLCIPLVALVCRQLLEDSKIALLAAFLWALDPLAIDFSRQAINDIYLAFFPLLGIYLTWRFMEKKNGWLLVAAGFVFGLGLASKWSVIFPLGVIFLFLSRVIWKETKGLMTLRLVRLAQVSAALIMMPILVYIITFLPWFGRGYSIPEWLSLQHSMFIETSQHTGYQPDAMVDRDIRAHEWFIRPVTFRDEIFDIEPGQQANLSRENNVTILLAVSSPFVWLLVLPAVAYIMVRGIRAREEGLLLLSMLFLFSYVPLVITRRPIWLNTALSVLPFALMAVAYFVWTIAGKFKKRALIISVYLALVLLVTPPLYILVIGKGMKTPVLKEYLIKHYFSAGPSVQNGTGAPSGRGQE